MGNGASPAQRPCCGGWPPAWARARRAEGKSSSSSAAAGAPSGGCQGREVLDAIFAIERRCLGLDDAFGGDPAVEELTVECMLDDETSKYFLCHALSSPIVIAYFNRRFDDLHLEDVRRALVDPVERVMRDSDSEYRVHRSSVEGDPLLQEDISYALRAPWPFSDREVLQRRWQLPMSEAGEGQGLAIVMRSFDDEALLPHRPDRVRAVAHKSAYLLRPDGDSGGPGLRLVVCQQLDLGGLCPAWAQRFITRFAVQRGVEWGVMLRDHCLRMREKRDVGSAAVAAKDPAAAAAAERQAAAEEPRSPVAQIELRGPMRGGDVLAAILQIERICSGRGADGADGAPGAGGLVEGLSVECLLDDERAKYCLCGSPDSPTVTGFIRVRLDDVYPRDVWTALVDREARLQRDPDSEYQVLRPAAAKDPHGREDVAFVWRAPWPFWDRDVLQRRWTYSLPGRAGVAIAMRSFEDDDLLPPREDRVRAFVHRCGYLLRPSSGDFDAPGLELTVCQQVDLGGRCPEWAQEMLTRWAVFRGMQWAEDLRQHCHGRRAAELPPSPLPTDPAAEGDDSPSAWSGGGCTDGIYAVRATMSSAAQ